MGKSKLSIFKRPHVEKPRLILSFSGWMDSGEVSTKTISYLIEKLNAEKFAEITSDGFYISNLLTSMEIVSLFRPNVLIKDGIIRNIEMPINSFYYDSENHLILFSGKEPNILWGDFTEQIFKLCRMLGVKEIYFVGSFAGLTPHTREPRIFCSVSENKLKKKLAHSAFRFTNYEGPSSIVSYIISRCSGCGIEMISLAAEIPAYIQGYNPRCIETAVKYICRLLKIHIDLCDLQATADDFEKRINDIVINHPELAQKIIQLEQGYDDETFNTEMGDLKNWLEEKGIRLD